MTDEKKEKIVKLMAQGLTVPTAVSYVNQNSSLTAKISSNKSGLNNIFKEFERKNNNELAKNGVDSISIANPLYDKDYDRFDREYNKFDREYNKFDRENGLL